MHNPDISQILLRGQVLLWDSKPDQQEIAPD